MLKFLTTAFLCFCCCMLCSEPIFCQAGKGAGGNTTVADSMRAVRSIRSVPENRIKKYQRSPDFAYANDPAYWKEPAPEKPGWSDHIFDFLFSKAFRIALFLLVLLLLIYGIYRLAKENAFSWFDRRSGPLRNPHPAAGQEDSSEAGLEEAVRKYTENGDYRMAVRYMYLKLIRFAAEKNAGFRLSDTNASMAEAFPDPQRAADFRLLATAYEYIFYGGFIPTREQFGILTNKFNLFHQSMEH
jgi:hypothetical protein